MKVLTRYHGLEGRSTQREYPTQQRKASQALFQERPAFLNCKRMKRLPRRNSALNNIINPGTLSSNPSFIATSIEHPTASPGKRNTNFELILPRVLTNDRKGRRFWSHSFNWSREIVVGATDATFWLCGHTHS
jgi:hypothetical protein